MCSDVFCLDDETLFCVRDISIRTKRERFNPQQNIVRLEVGIVVSTELE
jgi:hypothetical protein